MKNYGIILASGKGNRYKGDVPKQFIKIAGKTILEHTIEIFEKNSKIDNIIIVITPEYRTHAEEILAKNNFLKVSGLLNGGETRKESSYIGISSIEDNEANVIIHDCARPFLTQKILSDCIDALKYHDAIDVAIPSADTIIETDDENLIKNIPNRSSLKLGQTPQCFKLSLIKKAHQMAINNNNFTDDCGLIIKYKLGEVFVVEGSVENIKITYPSDVFIADRLFQIRSLNLTEDLSLKNIKDEVIVVFGGSGGIGTEICNLAKKHTPKVYSYSLHNNCDITNYKQVQDALKYVFDKEHKINAVINAAGVLQMGKLAERSLEDIYNDINVNYLGSVNVAKASIPYLKQTKGSLTLFTSSSYTRGRAMYSTYSSAKAAVVNLAQALAEELISDNIRVNVINPERTATQMRFNAFGKEPEESLLNPEKVAETTLKVVTSDITGQIIDVRK